MVTVAREKMRDQTVKVILNYIILYVKESICQNVLFYCRIITPDKACLMLSSNTWIYWKQLILVFGTSIKKIKL